MFGLSFWFYPWSVWRVEAASPECDQSPRTRERCSAWRRGLQSTSMSPGKTCHKSAPYCNDYISFWWEGMASVATCCFNSWNCLSLMMGCSCSACACLCLFLTLPAAPPWLLAGKSLLGGFLAIFTCRALFNHLAFVLKVNPLPVPWIPIIWIIRVEEDPFLNFHLWTEENYFVFTEIILMI